MKRKLAVIVCTALMTAMLGACGGSTSASGGQADAPAETAAEEAAPDAAAEEAAPAADAAPEAEAVTEETTPAAEAEAGDTVAEIVGSSSTFANGTKFSGVITPSEAADDADMEKIGGVGDQGALGSAPEIESIEGLKGDESSSINGSISLQGRTQEYSAFYLGTDSGIMGFSVLFADYDDTLTNYAEIYDFYKDAGYTRQDMLSLDVNQIYPGFTSMSCSDYEILDCGSFYRLLLGFAELDNPDNVWECMNYGIFIASDYHYPQVIPASTLKSGFASSGFYQMSDSEINAYQLVY